VPPLSLQSLSPNRTLRAALTVMVFLLLGLAAGDVAFAKAPPLATTVVEAAVYAAPDSSEPAIGAIPAGTQVELTGDAAPGLLAVYYDEGVVWVPAQYLALSDRPGIDTAVTLVETPLLEAPMADAGVVVMVPPDETVILTGASVDGYDAASHEGSGGWIDRKDIAQ
jgi:uncharacterized protein YraI